MCTPWNYLHNQNDKMDCHKSFLVIFFMFFFQQWYPISYLGFLVNSIQTHFIYLIFLIYLSFNRLKPLSYLVSNVYFIYRGMLMEMLLGFYLNEIEFVLFSFVKGFTYFRTDNSRLMVLLSNYFECDNSFLVPLLQLECFLPI